MFIKILISGSAAFAALGCSVAVAQTGGATGSYAASAIASGHLAEAERVLQPVSRADAADPARLINIAAVYARTQREPEAREALMRVQALPAEQLDLAGGASSSSHQIAQNLLARLDRH